MLQLATNLPPGALIGSDEGHLARAILHSGGARFVAREDNLIRTAGQITGWSEALGAIDATTAAPNIGHSRFDPGPPGALLCSKAVNCGFVLPGFASTVEAFTFAVVYRSSGDAKTLAAVSTGPTANVIFLNESEGQLTAKDKQSAVETSIHVGVREGAQLAILSFDGKSLTLFAGGRTASASGIVPEMDRPGDFFIGCRSNRSGLAKTLGEIRLHEVVFWPDRALIGSRESADLVALAALKQHVLWGL